MKGYNIRVICQIIILKCFSFLCVMKLCKWNAYKQVMCVRVACIQMLTMFITFYIDLVGFEHFGRCNTSNRSSFF